MAPSVLSTRTPCHDNNPFNPVSLKRARAADQTVTFNKRQCFADFDSDSPSDSSDDNDVRRNVLDLRRSMSLSAVAPVTTTYFSPPSPPHSSCSTNKHEPSSHPFRFHSNSELDNDVAAPAKRQFRAKSISVAALRRHRTVTNPEVNYRKRRQPSVPRSDLNARAKCFDYLVSAIDEVWAQYCTYTSCAEDEIYNVDEEEKQKTSSTNKYSYDAPISPASLCDEDGNYSSGVESYGPRTPRHCSFSSPRPMQMYKPKPQMYSRPQIVDEFDNGSYSDDEEEDEEDEAEDNANQSTVSDKNLAPSEQPGSVRLLNLKTRLMNAKYYFQDLVDADDLESSVAFWNRWDLIKYSAIELVEDDGDDDEVVEITTEKLEYGRYYTAKY